MRCVSFSTDLNPVLAKRSTWVRRYNSEKEKRCTAQWSAVCVRHSHTQIVSVRIDRSASRFNLWPPIRYLLNAFFYSEFLDNFCKSLPAAQIISQCRPSVWWSPVPTGCVPDHDCHLSCHKQKIGDWKFKSEIHSSAIDTHLLKVCCREWKTAAIRENISMEVM